MAKKTPTIQQPEDADKENFRVAYLLSPLSWILQHPERTRRLKAFSMTPICVYTPPPELTLSPTPNR